MQKYCQSLLADAKMMIILLVLTLMVAASDVDGSNAQGITFTVRGNEYSLHRTLRKLLQDSRRGRRHLEPIINSIRRGRHLQLQQSLAIITSVTTTQNLNDNEKSGLFFWTMKLTRNRNHAVRVFHEIFSNLENARIRMSVFRNMLELTEHDFQIRQIIMDNIFRHVMSQSETHQAISSIFRYELAQLDEKKKSFQFVIRNTTYSDCLGLIKAAYRVSIKKEQQGYILDIATSFHTSMGHLNERMSRYQGRRGSSSDDESDRCRTKILQWLESLEALAKVGNKTESRDDVSDGGGKGEKETTDPEGEKRIIGIGGGLGVAPETTQQRPKNVPKGGLGIGVGGGEEERGVFGIGCGVGLDGGVGMGYGAGMTAEGDDGWSDDDDDDDEGGSPSRGVGLGVAKGPKGGIGVQCRGIFKVDNPPDLAAALAASVG